MFRSFIYVNTEKVYEYYSLIDESIKEKIVSLEKRTTKSAGVSVKPIGLEHSKTETKKTEISQYFLSDYNKFETKLSELKGEDFFDFDLYYDSYDIKLVPRTSIGKISANFSIPEEFDYINLINKIKPFLKSSLDIKESEEGIYDCFFEDTKSDIPMLVEIEDDIIFGKLDTRFLNYNYNQLEEFEDDEVTILFKLISQKKSKRVTVFDPLKDFIKLNRTMRRSTDFKNETKEFSPIIIDGPATKVEVLAIYQ